MYSLREQVCRYRYYRDGSGTLISEYLGEPRAGFESDGSTDDQTDLSTYVQLAADRAYNANTCANNVEQCVGAGSVELDEEGTPQFPVPGTGIVCFDCFCVAIDGDGSAHRSLSVIVGP